MALGSDREGGGGGLEGGVLLFLCQCRQQWPMGKFVYISEH